MGNLINSVDTEISEEEALNGVVTDLELINLFLKDDIQEENEIAFINLINNIINISNIRPINSY